jgi:alpha-ketoglutarate-dependent taurine dioxygenase
MLPNYTGVRTRLLERRERSVRTNEEATPLVIEPLDSTTPKFLQEFLASHSSDIVHDIATHGAMLLRGFALKTEDDFERTVLSIKGLRGIDKVFMSEAGRTLVPNTRFVLHTNTNYKTGGTFALGGFHTENHYVPDVPCYISFFCRRASWIGGETGLVNVAKVYLDLSDTVRTKLEQRSFWVSAFPLDVIGARYQMSAERLESFCECAGLPVTSRNGHKSVVLYKPSVVQHPITKERALVINISAELNRKGLQNEVYRAFLPDYVGGRWIVHRLRWRFPWVGTLHDEMAMFSRRPIRYVRAFCFAPGHPTMPAKTEPFDVRVDEVFTTPEDIQSLAQSIRRRYSAFKWKVGDLLIIDNLKMAHAGMPGFGPRTLRALICNPIRMRYDRDASGVHVFSAETELLESLGAQLLSARG